MAKDLNISLLYDFYGELLTEKQQEAIELYYEEDLSLAEIADQSGISRQGVRDSIKRAEYQLIELENKLGLAKKFTEVEVLLNLVNRNVNDIELINDKFFKNNEIASKISDIKKACKDISKL